MPAKTDTDYLQDMLKYGERASTIVSTHSINDLETNLEFSLALQHCFMIIGEAASHISKPTRNQLMKIPWREIIGMRNWIVHGYERLDNKILWDTATKDLPILIEEILNFLPPEQT